MDQVESLFAMVHSTWSGWSILVVCDIVDKSWFTVTWSSLI